MECKGSLKLQCNFNLLSLFKTLLCNVVQISLYSPFVCTDDSQDFLILQRLQGDKSIPVFSRLTRVATKTPPVMFQ